MQLHQWQALPWEGDEVCAFWFRWLRFNQNLRGKKRWRRKFTHTHKNIFKKGLLFIFSSVKDPWQKIQTDLFYVFIDETWRSLKEKKKKKNRKNWQMTAAAQNWFQNLWGLFLFFSFSNDEMMMIRRRRRCYRSGFQVEPLQNFLSHSFPSLTQVQWAESVLWPTCSASSFASCTLCACRAAGKKQETCSNVWLSPMPP